MFPRDRMIRAGATTEEVDRIEALPEGELQSVIHRMEQVAESGVREVIEDFRRLFGSEADVVESVLGDDPPAPEGNTGANAGGDPPKPDPGKRS